jgi:hypothetical protein
VTGVLGQHDAQMSSAKDQHPVGELGPDGRHELLAKPHARGLCGGIFTTSMPAPAVLARTSADNAGELKARETLLRLLVVLWGARSLPCL